MRRKAAKVAMAIKYLNIFFPVIALSVNVSIQIMVFRYFARIGLWNSMFLGFFSGMLGLLIFECYIFSIELFVLSDFIAFVLVNVITYSLLGYCYFHFLNLGETARRIRILRELNRASIGLSLDDILKRYNASEIIERRVDRLKDSGQIAFKDDRYYIVNPTLLWIAKTLSVFKMFLLGKKSKFD